MKIKEWTIYFFNPFKKKGNERFIGGCISKDWHHEYYFDMRFSILKEAHLTICLAYTNIKNKEYVENWTHFYSKAAMKKLGGLKWYRHDVYRQDIEDGRNSCG